MRSVSLKKGGAISKLLCGHQWEFILSISPNRMLTFLDDSVRDVSQAGPRPDVDTAEQQMNVSALELQHQGFKIVETLASLHPQYLENQDEIVRALRWLWRSRGRHYRLLHEEEIPPRYQCESLALGKLLVSYAKANLGDIDALFDSIRVFLQPQSSVDFSFIKQFLLDTVSCADDDHKVVIIQR